MQLFYLRASRIQFVGHCARPKQPVFWQTDGPYRVGGGNRATFLIVLRPKMTFRGQLWNITFLGLIL